MINDRSPEKMKQKLTFKERLAKCEDGELPDEMLDPITFDPMEDPVTTSTINTFDRQTIRDLVAKSAAPHKTFECPFSGIEISANEVNNPTNTFMLNKIELEVANREKKPKKKTEKNQDEQSITTNNSSPVITTSQTLFAQPDSAKTTTQHQTNYNAHQTQLLINLLNNYSVNIQSAIDAILNGADIEAENIRGQSIIDIAKQRNPKSWPQKMLDRGIDPSVILKALLNRQDIDTRDAINLVNNHADKNTTNKNGETIIDVVQRDSNIFWIDNLLALQVHPTEVLRILINRPYVDLNDATNLIKNGANIEILNDKGETILDIALRNPDFKMVSILLNTIEEMQSSGAKIVKDQKAQPVTGKLPFFTGNPPLIKIDENTIWLNNDLIQTILIQYVTEKSTQKLNRHSKESQDLIDTLENNDLPLSTKQTAINDYCANPKNVNRHLFNVIQKHISPNNLNNAAIKHHK